MWQTVFSVLFVPVIMIFTGWLMWKHCPKEINYIWGYRSNRSMKNPDTWKFAHDYCGRLWWKLGWILLLPSVLIPLPLLRAGALSPETAITVICLAQCAILLATILPVEKALKKTFTDDGTRR